MSTPPTSHACSYFLNLSEDKLGGVTRRLLRWQNIVSLASVPSAEDSDVWGRYHTARSKGVSLKTMDDTMGMGVKATTIRERINKSAASMDLMPGLVTKIPLIVKDEDGKAHFMGDLHLRDPEEVLFEMMRNTTKDNFNTVPTRETKDGRGGFFPTS